MPELSLSRTNTIPPKDGWSDAEKWVWEKVIAGEIADFNHRFKQLDPKIKDGWIDERLISPLFIETILLYEPYKTALPRRGLRISGAWIQKSLDLSNANIVTELWIDGSRFEHKVDFSSFRSTNFLSFENSFFANDLVLSIAKLDLGINLSGITVSGTLAMRSFFSGGTVLIRNHAQFNEADLSNAKICGILDMNGIKVTHTFNMNFLCVESSMFLWNDAEINQVSLISAKIGGILDMSKVKVSGELNMSSIDINGHLFMRGEAEFGKINLLVAKIGGQLNMRKIRAKDVVNMEMISVGQNLFMEEGEFHKSIMLADSTIAGNVFFAGGKISTVNLGGIKINGELNLDNPNWDKNSFMVLCNAQIGALEDEGPESWPVELDLDGLNCSRIGGLRENKKGKGNIADREAKWFINWLKKDKSFSPQPYHHIATILTSMGHSERANTILYASKKRERKIAWEVKHWGKWIGLGILNLTIGYGLGARYFRSLIWVAVLTLIGIFVLGTVESMQSKSFGYKAWFSLDMLLPIIELNKDYALNFSGWQLTYFYFHELMGFLLGSFVLAGLSGITKK